MGFAGLFSTESNSYQFVENKQIGQSGANSLALSGDVTGNLNITSADPQIALAAINAAGQNQISALEALKSIGERFSTVAESSVADAGNVALNALPLTPEQITASRGDAAQKDLLKFGGVIVVAILIGVVVVKYNK